MKPSDWIFLDGEWKPWAEATVHVSTHALHYGSGAFEGIRAYATPDGPAIFRLEAHVRRLLVSCRILRMPMHDYPAERLGQLCIESISRNGLVSGYIRPLVFRGAAGLGLSPMAAPVSVCVFAVEWGRYLGEEGIERGVDAVVSSWRRFNASTAAPLGKITGQYVTNQFATVEAQEAGFAEGILLDANGMVSEGAGENLFLVFGETLVTPPLAQSILSGITRDSVLQLARDLGLEVRQEPVSRDMLYLADELFMTGTAAEITPVRSVDRIPIGDGDRGPVTERLQQRFFEIVEGRGDDPHGWRTAVPPFIDGSK